MQNKSRPKFLSLLTLLPKMSITAKASILHRASGVILVLSIPLIIFIFHQSLVSQDFYSTLYSIVSSPIIKILYIILIWGFSYHMCSGIRFLFLDINKGADIKHAKMSARVVIILSILLTLVIGALIW